jgi:hypothetical protein
MSETGLILTGWHRAKEYFVAVIAAAVMYGGTHQIVEVLKYVATGMTIEGINAVIHQGFRNRLPLPNGYVGIPWQYHVKVAATGVIVAAVGVLFGVWADARHHRRAAN